MTTSLRAMGLSLAVHDLPLPLILYCHLVHLSAIASHCLRRQNLSIPPCLLLVISHTRPPLTTGMPCNDFSASCSVCSSLAAYAFIQVGTRVLRLRATRKSSNQCTIQSTYKLTTNVHIATRFNTAAITQMSGILLSLPSQKT